MALPFLRHLASLVRLLIYLCSAAHRRRTATCVTVTALRRNPLDANAISVLLHTCDE